MRDKVTVEEMVAEKVIKVKTMDTKAEEVKVIGREQEKMPMKEHIVTEAKAMEEMITETRIIMELNEIEKPSDVSEDLKKKIEEKSTRHNSMEEIVETWNIKNNV